ncbi:hypothetical protein BaRGS_00037041 [Batillaria attramentaria]|uniref:DUF4773 domain-containing protein n=1 Tax=Batillaria attramentaria TaxID=370345 RepID=A0ABD0JB17_9CAEN
MALLRMRRRRVFLVLLIACLFWLMYLLTLLPSKGHPNSELHSQQTEKSTSRKHTTPYQLVKKVEPAKNVIEAPQLQGTENKTENRAEQPPAAAPPAAKPAFDSLKAKFDLPAIGDALKNKTYELGVKIKNKTIEVGQKMRNKTLEQLAVIGMSGPEKRLSQLIFVPQKWNLTVSFEDIGDIMKETQFLNKVDPLNLNGPILVSTRNRTTNFTYNMPLKFGFCDCFEHYCLCCSQITNKRLHLNVTACSNFTFVSKAHEFDLRFSLDTKPIHHSLVSADKPPLLCIGSTPKVADICVHFFNMTYKVNEHNTHQTQILGCTDMSLNLYNKTIGAFPVDCFQIPGDPNQVHKQRHNFNNMFNWMP